MQTNSAVWLLPFGLLLLSVIVVPISIFDARGLPRYRNLSAELAEVQRQNDQLRREVEALDVEVRALRTEPEAIERVARDELGLVHNDEILFQFPSE